MEGYIIDERIREAVNDGYDVIIRRNKDKTYKVQFYKPRSISKYGKE